MQVGSTAITDWTVTRDDIDVVGYWQAADGFVSLDLNGTPGVGGIAQAFPSTPGETYDVLFAQAANASDGGRISTMGVTAAGQSAQYSFDCTGRTAQNMGWTTRTWQFTAVDTTTTLEFYSLDTHDPYVGPMLDNVIVNAVPEPASLGILGLGAIGLMIRHRKSK